MSTTEPFIYYILQEPAVTMCLERNRSVHLENNSGTRGQDVSRTEPSIQKIIQEPVVNMCLERNRSSRK